MAAVLALALAVAMLGARLVSPTAALPPAEGAGPATRLFWSAEGLLCLLLLLGPARGLFREAKGALGRGTPSRDSPVALGAALLWLWATAAVLAPGRLAPPSAAPDYLSPALVAALVLLARWATHRALAQATEDPPSPVTAVEDQPAERAGRLLVSAALALSLLTFLAWLAPAGVERLPRAVSASAAVLFVASARLFDLVRPSALALALRQLSAAGVRLRDARVIERLARLDTLVLVKTGTLTAGCPRLIEIVPARGWDVSDVLRQVTAVERHSDHSLARAIVTDVMKRGIAIPRADSFLALPGLGARAEVAGRSVRVGSRAFLRSEGLDLSRFAAALGHLTVEGQTPVLVAVGDEVVGLLGVADAPRAGARDAVAGIRKLGLDVVLLSGGDQETDEALARQVGIGRVLAEIPRGERSKALRALKDAGRVVGLVGDAGRDAALLAEANVGLAENPGGAPMPAAVDVGLADGPFAGVPLAIRIARATHARVRRRQAWALAYNLAGLVAASGVLVPLLGADLRPSPLVAGCAVALSHVPLLQGALFARPARATG